MEEIKRILVKIDTKVDKMDDHLHNVDVTLAKQAKDLEYHIERTNILQDLHEDNEGRIDKLSSDVTRNTQGRVVLNKLSKIAVGLLSLLSLILGIAYGVSRLI